LCPNRTFHESKRGKLLDGGYREMGFLWIMDAKETKVECCACLHEDNLTDEFGVETSTFKAVHSQWITCTHKKVDHTENSVILCPLCFICVQKK
jgi:hypothetical protein